MLFSSVGHDKRKKIGTLEECWSSACMMILLRARCIPVIPVSSNEKKCHEGEK